MEKKFASICAVAVVLLTSFVARDIASPAQKFRVGDYEYVKDRGYAFEQKLDQNTRGLMNRQLKDIEADEKNSEPFA